MNFFKNFRHGTRLAAECVPKLKRLEENVKKLSAKQKEQSTRQKEGGASLKVLQSRLDGVESSTALSLEALERSAEKLQLLSGKLAVERFARRPAGTPFSEVEFQVFSQWGEDGIIQHLIHHLQPEEKSFIEFGVETYTEANTRFLLINDNWRGLILDGSEDNMQKVKQSELYWRHGLTAKAAFLTPGNVNGIIAGQGFGPRAGLLSIDIDGMDYWVLEAIGIQADILICEYNSVFGPSALVTVPPDDEFHRTAAHPSNLFYGMSLAAAAAAADRKGYDLVGVNSAGNNAFFIHRSVKPVFKTVTPAECFTEARFRESRSAEGELTHLDMEGRRREIGEVPAFDLTRNTVRPLKEIWKEAGL
ncbi:MAG: hypothetical protein JWM59_4157 [Verrucomicrobiales bacterium]|nr:hypothetical protein [Verrucomicrobiales bacterium]